MRLLEDGMKREVTLYRGWKRYMTAVWWKLQLLSLINGRPPLNIVATFEIDQSMVENIDNHKAYACECGSVHFNLLKSGKIECAGCSELDKFSWRANDA